MDIAVATDPGFAMQVGVVLASVAASTPGARVHVLHVGLEAPMRARLESVLPVGAVSWYDLEGRADARVQLPDYLPVASTFRLLMPEVLGGLDRVVYLDADVLVRHSLLPLAAMDLGGRPVAAVRDAVVPWAGSPRGLPWRELGLSPTQPYVNAGVLVLDLAQWRAHGLGPRAIEALVQRRLRYGDQCAINALGLDVVQLDPTWNLQVGHLVDDRNAAWLHESVAVLDAAIADPAVVHFNTGPLGRPWQSGCGHPFAAVWFEALDRTPWAGWRPSRREELLAQFREPGLAGRLRERLQVAARGLLRGEPNT